MYKKIILLGFGNIGQALSSLIFKEFKSSQVIVFDREISKERLAICKQYGFQFFHQEIKENNFKEILSELLFENDFVLNLATSISSHDTLQFCQEKKAFYLDTCIDPWEYHDGEVATSHNTNYQMRQKIMDLKDKQRNKSTALVSHGANPGFVSVLMKKALLMMKNQYLKYLPAPKNQKEWANLARLLDIRVIQISEKDSQKTKLKRGQNDFFNTWSVDGFVAEALQPAELGFGSHEQYPQAIHHHNGKRSAVYLKDLGVQTSVKTWVPSSGHIIGKLISHNEAISISEYLTCHDENFYRPTVYYAYRPCDESWESLNLLDENHRNKIHHKKVLKDDLIDGIDELGVLLLSGKFDSLWLGSQLDIQKAREIAPYNNATSLQVVGSIVAAMKWLEIKANQTKGIIESEDLDHDFIFLHAEKYWNPIVANYTDWTPVNKELLLQHFLN